MSLKKALLMFVVVVTGLRLVSDAAQARVVYVDADAVGPTHDGTSWCDAYLTLDEAVFAAIAFDIIRVADGTYTPDPTDLIDPRDATFVLKNLVEIHGGYAGCGADDPNERDPRRYETILSGDLNRNDGDPDGDNSENCYHVLTGSTPLRRMNPTAVLDGVTITAGNANGSSTGFRNYGGGILNNTCDPVSGGPTFRNCRITGNEASRAGGVYNLECSATLIDCQIVTNWSRFSGGGLVESSDGFVNRSTLFNCLIIDNECGSWGGGVFTDETNTILDNCTIHGNYALAAGGGVWAENSNPRFTNSIIWGNSTSTATDESAQIYDFGGVPEVDYCCVQGWTGDLVGENSFGDDPLFVPGQAGCLYLSQIDAGEPADSPCVDAGNDTAANLDLDNGVSTRSDELADAGVVDLGYHYPMTNEAFFMGDYDRNGIIDLLDFARLQNCFTADGTADLSPCCRIFDFDYDADIDLVDYAEFAVPLDQP